MSSPPKRSEYSSVPSFRNEPTVTWYEDPHSRWVCLLVIIFKRVEYNIWCYNEDMHETRFSAGPMWMSTPEQPVTDCISNPVCNLGSPRFTAVQLRIWSWCRFTGCSIYTAPVGITSRCHVGNERRRQGRCGWLHVHFEMWWAKRLRPSTCCDSPYNAE